MKQKAIRFSSIAAGVAFLTVFFAAAIQNTPGTNAITTADFRAGNIIDDATFYNKDTMSVDDIQAHLNRYMPACDTWGTGAVGSGRYINGVAVPANTTRADYARQMREAGKTRYHEPPYVCVQNYYENPTTHETLYETKNVVKDGMISAAQIIYNAAQQYNINPQVLLVLLKKESYVWGDNWPLKDEYNTVMGYACPDNAPCDEKYFGFYNQVMTAAWQLNYYKEHIYSYNYRPYATNYILYSPDHSCGRKEVYLENIATTSLYIYTPYTPNDAALQNYPGTATCGSYGNRNFFMYFSEWFGSTHAKTGAEAEEPTGAAIPDGRYAIVSALREKYVADIYGGKKEDGSNISTWTQDNNVAQVFDFTYDEERDAYKIVNQNSGKAIDLASAIVNNGITNIQISTVSDSCSQYWKVLKKTNGKYMIANSCNTSYVFDVSESKTTDGTNIILYQKNGGKNQEWSFDKISEKVVEQPASEPEKPDTPTEPEVPEEAPVQQKEPEIPNGRYAILSALRANYVIDVYGGKTNDGANISTWTQDNNIAQLFDFEYDAKRDAYRMVNVNAKKAISFAGSTAQDVANIQLAALADSCSQYWKITKSTSGKYNIASSCDESFAIDIAYGYTKDGSNIILYHKNSSKNQEWSFEKIESQSTAQTTQNTQAVANGRYAILSALRANYAADVYGGKTNDGANISTWTQDNNVAQIYDFEYDTKRDAYRMVNVNAKKAISFSGSSARDVANIQLSSLADSCSQYWKFIKTPSGRYNIASYCDDSFVIDVAYGYTKDGSNIILYHKNGSKNQEWSFEKI